MKRKITLLLSVALSALFFVSGQQYDFTVGGIYYKVEDATAKTVRVVAELAAAPFNTNQASGVVNIPATVNNGTEDFTVVRLAGNSFRGCTGITAVTIADGITRIGYDSFYGCTGLQSVQIPNSVTTIENRVFYQCVNLTTANLPPSLTVINENLFYGCSSLTSINIPSGVTEIKLNAFNGCSALQSVVLPDGITAFGNSAFSACASLTSINLPASLKTMGTWALGGCKLLTTLTIPAGVTSIGNNAFNGCTGLTSLTSLIENPSTATLGTTVFQGINKSIPLYVPNGTQSLYQAAPQWQEFTTINPIPTGVDNAVAEGVSIVSHRGALDVMVDNGQQVRVYDVTGKLRTNQFVQSQERIHLPAGVYVVKIGNYAAKAVVR